MCEQRQRLCGSSLFAQLIAGHIDAPTFGPRAFAPSSPAANYLLTLSRRLQVTGPAESFGVADRSVLRVLCPVP